MNLMLFPTLLVASGCFGIGLRLAGKHFSSRTTLSLTLTTLVLVAPAILFAIYYTHYLDNAQWLYEFRAISYSELTAGGAGLLAGMLYRWWNQSRIQIPIAQVSVPIALGLLLLVPYAKPFILPLNTAQLRDQWKEGICIQTSSATCGPSSAATLLRAAGKDVTERELAEECYTCATGTECWYLIRALRQRGMDAHVVILGKHPERLLYPSIAGTTLGDGGAGHFVTVLDKTREGYVVGDPFDGRKMVSAERPNAGMLQFTGFFVMVKK